jgi:hypothetical protein
MGETGEIRSVVYEFSSLVLISKLQYIKDESMKKKRKFC